MFEVVFMPMMLIITMMMTIIVKYDWTLYVWRLRLASVPTSDSIKIECNVATAQSTLL